MSVSVFTLGKFTYAQRNGGTPRAYTKRKPGDFVTGCFDPEHGWLPGAAFRTEREALAHIKRCAGDPDLDHLPKA